MPNIKPVSDLRNYTTILDDVSEGSPVFLTKNGYGKYAVVDIHEYEKTKAALQLLTELSAGEKSAEEHGYIPAEKVQEILGL